MKDVNLKDKVDNKDVKDEETTTTSDSSWPLEDVKSKDKVDNKDVKDEGDDNDFGWLLAIERCRSEGQGRQ